MREIKFRAWDGKNNVWLLGYEYENLGGFSMFGEIMLMDEWNAVVHSHHRGEIDLNLMQYTGLKDKNGVEIYEGDILRFLDPDDFDGEEPHLTDVSWHQEQGCWITNDVERTLGDVYLWYNELEVIGNIYENPELLGSRGGDE